MSPKILTDCRSFMPWILCLFSLPPNFSSLIYKWNAKITGPQSSFFFLSPGKMLLMFSMLQELLDIRNETVVASVLKISMFLSASSSWCIKFLMHWCQHQSVPCEPLPSFWFKFCLKSQALRLNHPGCLSTFFYHLFPNNYIQTFVHDPLCQV